MARCIELDGTTYMVGLFWQTLSSVKNQTQELRQISEDLGLPYACVISFPALQAGFAEKEALERATRPISLAAHLVGVRGGSWIGVYPLGPDRYYYIAVREDVILPEGDRVGDRSEIENQLHEHLSMEDASWDDLYGPEEFGGRENWTQERLSTILSLQNENAHVRVKSVRFQVPRSIRMVGAAIVLIGVLWWGGSVWLPSTPETSYESIDPPPTQSVSFTRNKQEKDASIAIPEASDQDPEMKPAKPWEQMYRPDVFLSTCESRFSRGRMHVAGWRLSRWRCETNRSTSEYKREAMGASIQQLGSLLPRFTLEAAGQRVLAVRNFSSRLDSSNRPGNGIQVRWDLQDRLQRLGYPVTFTKEHGDTGTWDHEVVPYQTYLVQWTMDVSPFGLDSVLRPISGFYFRSIEQTYNQDDMGRWSLRGTLYVKH